MLVRSNCICIIFCKPYRGSFFSIFLWEDGGPYKDCELELLGFTPFFWPNISFLFLLVIFLSCECYIPLPKWCKGWGCFYVCSVTFH